MSHESRNVAGSWICVELWVPFPVPTVDFFSHVFLISLTAKATSAQAQRVRVYEVLRRGALIDRALIRRSISSVALISDQGLSVS